MSTNGLARSAEWKLFEANAEELRADLVRTLRRELVHDPRSATARTQNVSVADLADEAIAWALENWKAKPTATEPELWVLKHALQFLDEALDAEALAAESLAEESATERRLVAHDLVDDAHDEERADWLDMAGLALRGSRPGKRARAGDVPFDGLECDPQLSSPVARLDDRETLVQLERAMLALPERRRKTVALRYLDDLTVEEIAYLLDVSIPAVESEIAAGLAELQSALATT